MTALSFTQKLFLELVLIILLVGVLETLFGPYFGFAKPAPGSGVMPLGLLAYGCVRYGLYKLSGLYKLNGLYKPSVRHKLSQHL